MENRKFTKVLSVPLTVEERLNLSDELVGLNAEHNKLDDDKAECVADFKAKEKVIETKMNVAYRSLRTKTKMEDIEVEEYLDEATKQVIQKRLDTLAIVNIRAATTKELNHELFEDEDSLALSFTRHDEELLERLAALPEGTLPQPVTLESVQGWEAKEYRAVLDWLELFNYAAEHPEDAVEVCAMPEVLTRESGEAKPVEAEGEKPKKAAEKPKSQEPIEGMENEGQDYQNVRCIDGTVVRIARARMPKRAWYSAKYLTGKGEVRLYDDNDRSIGAFDCDPVTDKDVEG